MAPIVVGSSVLAPTGNRFEMGGIQMDHFDEGGRTVEEWPEYDLLGAVRQMSAIPGPQQ